MKHEFNIENSYNCRFCTRNFTLRQYRWRHEKKCKLESDKIVLLENKIKELENKIITTNNTNNGTINNSINNSINNITNIKVSFGDEEIDQITSKEKKNILNSGYSSLVKLIELVHLNKGYPQFQNIKINNLKDKFAKIVIEFVTKKNRLSFFFLEIRFI